MVGDGGPVLALHDLACGYRGRAVLQGIDLAVGRGDVLALLGPNGVGKTTLFKTVLGLLPPLAGEVRVDGRPLGALTRGERARLLGYVPQSGDEPFGHRVLDVVLLGRTASLGWRPSPSRDDLRIARDCLERLDVGGLAERGFGELSGGERQLVLVARALAQQPQVLVMDEPTANLDLGNEVRVLACVRDLAAEGLTVVLTSHRPEHAFTVATAAMLAQPDGTYRVGPVHDVLTAEAMGRAYGIDVHVSTATISPHGEITRCTALLPRPGRSSAPRSRAARGNSLAGSEPT